MAEGHAVNGAEGMGAVVGRAEAGGRVQPAQCATLLRRSSPGPGGSLQPRQSLFRFQRRQRGDAGRPFGYGHGELLTQAAAEACADAGGGPEAGVGAEKGMGSPAVLVGLGVVRRSMAVARWRL